MPHLGQMAHRWGGGGVGKLGGPPPPLPPHALGVCGVCKGGVQARSNALGVGLGGGWGQRLPPPKP